MIRVNGRLSNLLILGLRVHGCCHPCIKTRIVEHLLLNCRYFAAICQNAARRATAVTALLKSLGGN